MPLCLLAHLGEVCLYAWTVKIHVLTLHIGPQYSDDNIFDLNTMQPYNLKHIYDRFAAYVPDFVLFLPRSSDLNQLAKYAPDDKKLEVVHYCTNGSSKVSHGA
jgi:hypothetical protein